MNFSVGSTFWRSKRGAAALIGCLFVFLALFIFGKPTDRTRSLGTKASRIGEVSVLLGEADARLPGALTFTKLNQGDGVMSGEMIAVHEAAQVTLKFENGGSIRLQPASRLVMERDSARGSVLATLLNGDADVLAQATGFRMMKDGHDITATGSIPPAPEALVVNGGARVFTNPKREVVVAASTPVETPPPAQAPTARLNDESGDTSSADSLSNEEIRRAMNSEAGFYRRCYLTYLNRTAKAAAGGATITVGFVISNSGKVRDAKVVRSDVNDSVLTACVLETVERTPFRAFKASDIPILEFPIELK